jgi:exopolysaccharide biosynthesis polyprenyl glycosylphosphotransferase
VDKNKGSSWAKHWDFMLLDIFCLIAALTGAYVLRHGRWDIFRQSLYREVAFVLFLSDFFVAYFFESYQGILRRDLWNEWKAALKHVVAVFAIVFVFLFATQKGDLVSRSTIAGTFLLSLIFIYAGRNLLKKQLKKRWGKGRHAQALLLLTSKSRAEEIIAHLLQKVYGDIRLIGVVLADGNGDEDQVSGIPVVSSVGDMPIYVKGNWVDSIFVSLADGCSVEREVLDSCILMGVTVHFDVKQFSQLGTQYVSKLGDYKVLSTSVVSGSARAVFIKRWMDIVGGLVGCIFTGLIFCVVAPCIYLKSPGPIFFSQERIGKGGRRFRMYKFRSMYVDAEERKKELMEQNKIKDGFMFKMEKDPRIIPGIGEFIRKTSIDEFPQFFNVLKGDMSLVGTRPPTVDEWVKYETNHRTRMAIQPGITGLWQVSGRSEIVDFEQVVALDIKYITEWNLGLDIQILLKTLWVVIKGEGSC